MTIDTSGKWWVGHEPGDIEPYLKEFKPEGYEIHAFRPGQCACGCLAFELEYDVDEGVARRSCVQCNEAQFICDSEVYWTDTQPKRHECVECRSRACNYGVGFSLFADSSSDVRWASIGVRCAHCGVLGCVVDWKLSGETLDELISRV
jgi:hypothetical protein